MDSRRDQGLIVLLVLAVLALALVTTPDGDAGSLDPRPSTFRAAPPGALALYLTLEALDVPVERRLVSWVDGLPLRGTLVLLAPAQPLTPLEVTALVEWVEQGGALVVAAGRVEPPALFARLGLERTAVSGDPEPALADRRHAWSRDIDVVEGFAWRFDAEALEGEHPDAEIVLRTAVGRHPVAVRVSRGQGTVVAWSDAAPLTNARLRASGAATVFARAAADLTARDAPLVFDEFHHGYRDGTGPARAVLAVLLSTPPGWMALQLAVVALGLLWLHGRRFGAPHEPVPARRRSPLEHVEALASAYEQGTARETARRLIVAGLARRIGLHVPSAGGAEAWLRQLAHRGAGDHRHAEALYDEWRRGAGGSLVALADHADAVARDAGLARLGTDAERDRR